MNKIITSLLVCLALSCGVKGPPEPPLVTEGSLKKEAQEQKIEAAAPAPVPEPVKKTKKNSKAKAQ